MLRSWMFVPGDNEKMLGKAAGIAADALVFDLEDAVVESRKEAARDLVRQRLEAERGPAQYWVRINALGTPHAAADLEAIAPARPAGIVLPKAEHGEQAEQLAADLESLESRHGLAKGAIRIVLIAFESPRAVLNLASFGRLHPRVAGISWGAEDMAAGIGAQSNRNEHGRYTDPYVMVRSLCLMVAGATGVQAIDTAFTDFRDAAGLALSCREARRDGFRGKIAIHPGQLDTIHAAFTPGERELERARAIVAAFEANPGAGTVGLEGEMLDRPHLRQARQLLGMDGE